MVLCCKHGGQRHFQQFQVVRAACESVTRLRRNHTGSSGFEPMGTASCDGERDSTRQREQEAKLPAVATDLWSRVFHGANHLYSGKSICRGTDPGVPELKALDTPRMPFRLGHLM